MKSFAKRVAETFDNDLKFLKLELELELDL